MTSTFFTSSAEETMALAAEILKSKRKAQKPLILKLQGELGSGKTTFARGIARTLGIQQPIKSPTFTYLQSYDISQTKVQEYGVLFHFDLYRLPEDSRDFPELSEALEEKDAVILIEWPERIPFLSERGHLYRFKKKGENHEIKVDKIKIDI